MAPDAPLGNGWLLDSLGRGFVVLALGQKAPEVAGARIHEAHEIALGAADFFGERDGDVVGGFGDERANRILDLDGRARLQSQLGRLRTGSGF